MREGDAYVVCHECGKGIHCYARIQRDNHWECSVIKRNCSHYTMWIDVYTNNSFVPWTAPDEVRFECFSRCRECNSEQYLKFGRTSFNSGSSSHKASCHGNTVSFRVDCRSNNFGTIIEDLAMGTLYHLMPSNIGNVIYTARSNFRDLQTSEIN